jgi:hypothetical protein
VSDRYAFLATNEGGKITFDDSIHLRAALGALPKRISVTIERERIVRTTNQNARYWSLIVPLVAECWSLKREMPISNDMAHYALKCAFIGVEETPLGPVPKSSRTLTVPEFAEYMEKIEAYLAQEFGLAVLPSSEVTA